MKKLTVLDLNQELISDQDVLDLQNYRELRFHPIENLRVHLSNVKIVHMWPGVVNKGLSGNISSFRRYE